MTLPCPTDIGNPTPGTDAISLLDIQNEFDGGINPISITEYYRDGPYVKSYAEGTTDNIPIGPAGNQISFSDFFCTNGEIIVHINKNTLNPDVSKLFGTYWTSLRPKRLIVDNGIYVYNTNPYKTTLLNGYAMRVWDTLIGQLTIENYGFIQGAGGRYGGSSIIAGETRTNENAGGQGGNAIYIGPTTILVKFNRYWNGSKHYYGETPPTTGYIVELPSPYFGVYLTQASGTIPLYRLSNPVTGAQLLVLGSEYTAATSSTASVLPLAGTTTVTGLNYIPGYIRVFVNSIEVNNYTANDGTSITFFQPLPAFGSGSNAVVQILKSKTWTGEGVVGYVYSSSAPNYIAIYRSYTGPSNALATDFLFSTSSTEGPNAGYTSQGIAFYAPPLTGAAANPKPTIYIKNYGQIAAGGGGGGKGGDGDSESFSLASGYFTGTVTNRATVGGLGQGYGQVNTSSDKNLIASAQNVIASSSATGIDISVPTGSDNVTASTSGGGIIISIDSYSSNIVASSSAGSITAYIAPYVTDVTLSSSGGGITLYVSSNTSNIRVSSSAGSIFIYGAGADKVSSSTSAGTTIKDNNGQNYPQNIPNLSAYLNDNYYNAPSPSGAAGAGGDGGTFGNPGGNGQNGSTSNGSPGGPAGVAIYGISYVVGGVTGNAVLGSTTE